MYSAPVDAGAMLILAEREEVTRLTPAYAVASIR